ncbi:MAG: hypothetical protein R2744_10625 [Bacteroidales bacterium]
MLKNIKIFTKRNIFFIIIFEKKVRINKPLKNLGYEQNDNLNRLREIKDQLPQGGKIHSKQAFLKEETVRNYFGGWNYDKGVSVGIHMEQGPDGGLVTFDDTTISGTCRRDMVGITVLRYVKTIGAVHFFLPSPLFVNGLIL